MKWLTAARSPDAGIDHIGGYRMSSLEQRQLQNATAERWPLAPDPRIGMPVYNLRAKMPGRLNLSSRAAATAWGLRAGLV